MRRLTLSLLCLVLVALAVCVSPEVRADSTACDEAQSALRVLNRQIQAYAAKHGALPQARDWYRTLQSDGWVPAGGERDPWGHAYVYSPRGDDFDIRSVGRDGQYGTADDQTKAQDWKAHGCASQSWLRGCGRW